MLSLSTPFANVRTKLSREPRWRETASFMEIFEKAPSEYTAFNASNTASQSLFIRYYLLLLARTSTLSKLAMAVARAATYVMAAAFRTVLEPT